MLVICHQNSWYPCCYYICVHISLEFECSLRLFAYELVGMQLLTLKGWSFYSLAYSRGSQTLRPALILGLGHLAFVHSITKNEQHNTLYLCLQLYVYMMEKQ